MAGRLLDAGHELTVWNRTPGRAAALVARGARLAPTPAEAARRAEVAITMLADPAVLEAVVFGAGGLREGLSPGSTFIEMSTVGPDAVRSVAGRLPPGVTMLDAPVLGSVPQATDGSLKIFVGGTPADFERWSGLLGALGRPVLVGPAGAGAAMKLVANSTLGALMTALGEALALADALGLDERVTLDVLADSPIGITARSKREHIQSGTYPPRFRLALAGKDSRLVNEAGVRCGFRLAPVVRSWFEAAAAAGFGDLDYSAVIAHIRGRTATLE